MHLNNETLAYYVTVEGGIYTGLLYMPITIMINNIEGTKHVIWCKDNELVEYSNMYLECPPINTLLLQYDPKDIVSLHQAEPSSCMKR